MRKSPRNNRRCGAVALEAALMMPFFLLLLIGILEFGRALMILQITTNAAREAARISVIQGTTDELVTKIVSDYLSSADISATGQVVEIRDNTGSAVSIATIPSHAKITIFVSVPFQENSFGMTQWFVGETIATQVTVRRE